MLGVLRVLSGSVGVGRVGDEEGVLLVARGMLLGNEEGVEVPETGLDVPRRVIKE